MLNYVPFYSGIWSDKKFKKLPDSDSRVVFIYAFTNPSISLTGIYEFDKEECQLKSRLKSTEFEKTFTEVCASGKYNIEWDEEQSLIFVTNRFRLIPTKSPKVIVGAIEELNRLGKHPFREKFILKYKSILEPFLFRLDGHVTKSSDILTEDFILNASKIYNSKESLTNFMLRRGIDAEKISTIINDVLPQMK